ncbi:MAG: phage tail sheath subtilisin-like domain-containing protein [Eubacteriales bacterium]
MASFFTIGETKTRPGMYYRYENWGTPPAAGADDGKCACTLRSDWGPLDSAVLLESYDVIGDYFGSGGAEGSVEVPLEQFYGGAKSVRAVRVGTGGTKGYYKVMDEGGTEVLSLLLKYVGSRPLTVTLRPTVDGELEGDTSGYELLILEGTTQLERITFDNHSGEKEAWDLTGKASNYVDFLTIAVTDSKLATFDQGLFVGGTDPEVTVDAYANAFGILENYRWNVLALDTDDLSVQMMSQAFVNRIYEDGMFAMAVVGEATTTAFETRLARASAFNDYQMVYVGSGFVDMSGKVYQGVLAAARISGLIAGTSSSKSVTHLSLTGAVDLVEYLSNAQQEEAIAAGMLTFSLSSSNVVWVESGVNTLVNLGDDQDGGWQKVKRTKVRFELFQRLADTVEGLVGRVNNNSDGRATIIQACNNICNTMVAEGKLHTGAFVSIDPDNSPAGDSAWFVVYADDVDALEKLYYNFKFRFAVED